jgi:SOS-response transcriptional repressor LexA
MGKKQITPEDLVAAKLLRMHWWRWQKERVAKGLPRLSQETVGKQLGMTQGAISQYLCGATPLGTEAVFKFAKLMDINPVEIRPEFEYANIGTYQTLISEGATAGSNIPGVTVKQVYLIEWHEVCLIHNIQGILIREKRETVFTTNTVSDGAFALKVTGDSMEPEFVDGDIIIVDPRGQWEHGSYVVVAISKNSVPFLRRVTYDGGMRYLTPLNPRYPVALIDDNTVNYGEVTAKQRQYRITRL